MYTHVVAGSYFATGPQRVKTWVGALFRFMDKVVEEKDRENPRIATLLRPRFDHLPPTLFIVAECDIVRDDSYG